MNRQRLSTLAAVALIFAPTVGTAQSTIPSRLSDKEIWQLNADFSEAGGYFRSDNLLSNETGFQAVIPYLRGLVKPGGVYLGVGPEQNFTYIVSLQPKIAIIFDIRRGNMIEHLMYKALLETSADRADFLSKLFSRPRPPDSTRARRRSGCSRRTSRQRRTRCSTRGTWRRSSRTWRHTASRWATATSRRWSTSTRSSTRPVRRSTTTSRAAAVAGFGRGNMPTYATLQEATDTAGKNWAYLATEANYRWLKDFETKNLLVPVVGNFAGPKAIRAVAQYLKEHHAVVAAFYTSNVEQYLFQQDDEWSRFYKNVATLPLDTTSTFIRSIGGGFRGGYNTAVAADAIRRPPRVGHVGNSGSAQGLQRGQDPVVRRRHINVQVTAEKSEVRNLTSDFRFLAESSLVLSE